jgi:hypothetical protein
MSNLSLPYNIQREFDAAIARTGMTEALLKAQRRIPTLLSLPPSSYEALVRIRESALDTTHAVR